MSVGLSLLKNINEKRLFYSLVHLMHRIINHFAIPLECFYNIVKTKIKKVVALLDLKFEHILFHLNHSLRFSLLCLVILTAGSFVALFYYHKINIGSLKVIRAVPLGQRAILFRSERLCGNRIGLNKIHFKSLWVETPICLSNINYASLQMETM